MNKPLTPAPPSKFNLKSPIESMTPDTLKEVAEFLEKKDMFFQVEEPEKNYLLGQHISREIAIQKLKQTKRLEFKCANKNDIANLRIQLQHMPNLKELKISGLSSPCEWFNTLLSENKLKHLTSLEITESPDLGRLPHPLPDSLTRLTIKNSNPFMTLPTTLPNSLEILKISDSRIFRVPKLYYTNLTSLIIEKCSRIIRLCTTLPRSVKTIEVTDSPRLTRLWKKIPLGVASFVVRCNPKLDRLAESVRQASVL